MPPSAQGGTSLLKLAEEIIDLVSSSQLIHYRVVQWMRLVNGKEATVSPPPMTGDTTTRQEDNNRAHKKNKTTYIRLSPNDIGHIPLDESNMEVLHKMEKTTATFMQEENQQQLLVQIQEALGL